jgi:hypothetical protein
MEYKFDVFEAIKSLGKNNPKMLAPWEQDELVKHVGVEFIKNHADAIDAFYVLKNKKLDREDLEFFLARATKTEDFMIAAVNQELTEDMMHRYAERLPWTIICSTQKMSSDFIADHIEMVDQSYLPYHQKLNPNTARSLTEVNWMALSAKFPLSEDFILEYADKLDKYELKSNKRIELTDKVRLLLELS